MATENVRPPLGEQRGRPSASARPTESRRAFGQVEGVPLHWVEFGERGDGTPVVLLHGLNDSHATWRRVAPALARDRLVLALDLPGHGHSGRPDAGYELAWYARVVGRWLEASGLERVDVVGHSFGGGVAQMLLLEHRPRLRRLVLAAPGGLGKDIAFALRLASLPHVVERLGQPFMALGTRLALRVACEGLEREHVAERSAMNGREGTARAFARTVRDLIDWRGQRHNFLARAHELADLPPIAVLWGDRDGVIPAAHGEALERAVEGVLFRKLAGRGHYLHHEDPEAFAAAVLDALDAPAWPPVRLRPAPPAPPARRRALGERLARARLIGARSARA
ncbi:MAG TPA: alpha/beta fold hydrolase [Polyangiaceae bacterium]|nr:alpha/beta fold hydrolase [Polyangiaceae bacterium]